MDVKKLITMSPELWHQVQTWRFNNRVETATDAIRQLIMLGLAHTMVDTLKRMTHEERDEEPEQPYAA